MYLQLLVLTVVSVLVAPTAAQSFNIDFNDDRGTPSALYGAAGNAGVWNNFTAGTSLVLRDLTGQLTSATLDHDGHGYQWHSFDEITGDDEALLADYLFSFGPPLRLSFDDLQSGHYKVLTYVLDWFTATAPVMIDDDPSTVQEIEGDWTGQVRAGKTHAVHLVDTDDGSFTITVDGCCDPIVSGVQLVRCPADIDRDGSTGPGDVEILINAWGATQTPGAPADIDGNGDVGFSDVLVLLGQWGPCS